MCTIFVKRIGDGVVVGRNFDWIQKGGTMHFLPSYRSYGCQTSSICILEQMGVDRPYEGFNSHGVFIMPIP